MRSAGLLDMHGLIVCLFLLTPFTNIVGAIAFFTTQAARTNASTFPPTPTRAHGLSTALILTPSSTAGRHHPRDFAIVSNAQQAGTAESFPTFAVVLLALSIVACACSSVFIITIFYSSKARARVGSLAIRVYSSVFSLFVGHRKVNKDLVRVEAREEKEDEEVVLDITPANNIPSYSLETVSGAKSESTAASSQETVATTLTAPSSVKLSTSSHERIPVATHPPSPVLALPNSPSSQSSPLLDRLQIIVSAMLQSLMRDAQTRCSPPLSSRSMQEISLPTDGHTTTSSGLFLSSAPGVRSTDITSTMVGAGVSTQDLPDPSPFAGQDAFKPEPSTTPPLPIPQSPFSINDHPPTHPSPSLSSSSTFYSLSDETGISTSLAFQSLVDLTVLVASHGNASNTPPSPGFPRDDDLANNVLSPRYVHGVQLETIQEENDAQDSSNDPIEPSPLDHLTISALPSRIQVHTVTVVPEVGSPPVPFSGRSDEVPEVVTISRHYAHGTLLDTIPEDISEDRHSATSFWTEHIPNTWDELSDDPKSPRLPRFLPAARPAPSPSEPKSGVAVVSALRSPERSDRRRSVAWLSPVIEWAVDDPSTDRASKALFREPILEEIIGVGIDNECEEALHAAGAMAAVMDSLASIGLDPTDMGLTSGDKDSPDLSDSGVLAARSSLSLTDSLNNRKNLHAQAAAADLVEEQEVETEIGIGTADLACKSPAPDPLCSPLRDRDFFSVRGGSTKIGTIDMDQQQEKNLNAPHLPGVAPANPDRDSAGDMVQMYLPGYPAQTVKKEGPTIQAIQREGAGLGTHPKKGGERAHIKNASIEIMEDGLNTSLSLRRARSPPSHPPIQRTPRSVQPDRMYPSPSSLAGLSPSDVAKRFSYQSLSSAGSTPSPRGKRPTSPQHHSSPISPLQPRRAKGTSFSPTLNSTPSTLTYSPYNESVSPSPRSQSPMFPLQYTAKSVSSPLDSSHSTPTPHSRRNPVEGPVSPLQAHKPAVNSQLGRSPPVLHERTNSMEFDQV